MCNTSSRRRKLESLWPEAVSAPRFDYARVERLEDVPPRDDRIIDVAVLDMNHGLPNIGHHAIVAMLVDAVRRLRKRAAR